MKNVLIILNLFLISTVFAQVKTVRDNFNTVSFSNNDGSDSWTTDWIENDVAGVGASTGNVYITTNKLSFDDEPDTGTEPSAEREADISSAIGLSATLTFDIETGPGLDSGSDYLTISVSSNGGTSYTVLEAITETGSFFGPKRYDISAYASSETRIKFSITGLTEDVDEYFKIDNVQIQYSDQIEHVRDNFSTVSFSNSDGTIPWATDWIEVDGDGLGPSTGNVLITSNKLYLDESPDTGGEPGVEREVDLSIVGNGTVTFTFDYEGSFGLEAGEDILTISVSSDGGSNYTTLEDISSAGAVTGSKSYDISAYASSETRIKFSITAATGEPDEYFLIDNVTITYYLSSMSFSTISQTVAAGSDDAEEEGPDGTTPNKMWLDSSDLELVSDFWNAYGTQKVGLRFTTMTIPAGATITDAYLTFHCISADDPMTNSDVTNLTIQGELIANAPTFTTTYSDISDRTRTTASTSWVPQSWTDNLDYDSPSIVNVIQEIIDQVSWVSGNAIAIIITGTGHRASASYDGSSSDAAKLVVTYTEIGSPDCLIEVTAAWGDLLNTGAGNYGQSFTACGGGVLTSIGILGNTNQTGLQMEVYEGEGLGGTLLGTFSNISVHDAVDEYDFSEIDVSSENIVVTSGSVYTFNFGSTSVNLYNSIQIDYAGGVAYKNGNADGLKDLAFSVVIEDQLLPVELATFTAFFVNNNVELNWATETEVNNIGFEIERKYQESSFENQDEKQSWETIGFVKGYGHSNSPKYYSFVDENINSNSNYSYRLKQIDNDGSYAYSQIVELVQTVVPLKFNLSQNYPNPFNPTTNISFSIPNVGSENLHSVQLVVYDILGSEVAEIVNDKLEAGNYNYEFDASLFSNGVYFYTLKTSDFVQTKKMILIK